MKFMRDAGVIDANTLRSIAPALLFVNVSWCGHCTRAKPLMEKVATALGSTVPVLSVDGDKNKALAQQLEVQSYPTILLATKEGAITFLGERTFDQIIGFVCSNGLKGDYCGREA
jgi:thioredoxin-like negative regulator of GroEL